MCKSKGQLCGSLLPLLLPLLLAVARTGALPVSSGILDSIESDYGSYEDYDYDVVFDQRQNGTANVRVSVDGVVLALPGPEAPSSASLVGATLLDLFASQLAAGGETEDDVSDEIYGGAPGASSTSGTSTSPSSTSTTSSSTSTTSTTTTVAPGPAIGGISNDFAFETLPVSLLGQGLNFLLNTRRGEIPFRVNPGLEPSKQTIPLLITKVEKGPPAKPQRDSSSEESDEVAEPQHVPKEPSGRKKRKHKRKYQLRVASMLRPLLQRTAGRQ